MKVEIIRNDITNMNVDAVVLPANTKLKEGKGTSGFIFEKAGRKKLEKACKEYGHVNVGEAVPTLGYDLEVDYIIHAVVPKWKDGKHQEYELLCATYISALSLADNMGCESVAFPLLAAGNNGFDLEMAYEIAIKSFETYEVYKKLSVVYLVVYNREVMDMFRKLNVSVKEVIDESYILKKKEEERRPIKRIIDEGRENVHNFIQQGVDTGKKIVENQDNRKIMMELAVEWLKKPENQKRIINTGKKIANLAIGVVLKKRIK